MYLFDLISTRTTILCVFLLIISISSIRAETQHFSFSSNTGNNATIILPIEVQPLINGDTLVPGDEIGVFTPDELCVGAIVWKLEAQSITIWGNNEETQEIDGIEPGDSIHFRVWRQSDNTEYKNIDVTYSDSQPFYRTDGIYIVDGIYLLTSMFSFPEPEAPELSSPPDNAEDIDTSVLLEWSGRERTDSFNLQVSRDEEFSDLVLNESGISGSSYEITGLSYQSNYFWRVSGTNLAGTGDWSDTWRFSTLDRFIMLENPSQSTVWVENSTHLISWQIRGVEELRIEYSIGNGSDWQIIAEPVDAGIGQYEWTVPATPTTSARIRLTDIQHDNTIAISPVFSIYPRQISIEHSMSFGNPSSVTSYRMIGLPGNNNLPISSVMDGTAGSDWTAFWDNGSNDDYLIEYNGSNMFNIRPGRGFWVLSRNGFSYQSNRDAVQLNSEHAYEIPLHNGWNIISNPYNVDIDWTTVQTLNDINVPLWDYEGSFRQRDTMQPYRGYYFHNNNNLSSLAIPYPNAGNLSNQIPDKPLVAQSLIIQIQKDETTQSDVRFDIADSYTKQIDRYTVYAPPSDFEEASIRTGSGRVHTALINPSDEGYSFDLHIRVPGNKNYTLYFRGMDTFEGYGIVLVNRNSGKTIEMDGDNKFQFNSEKGREKYTLIIGTGDYVEKRTRELVPDEFTLAQNFPNPFNPVTTIEYSIPERPGAFLVTLEIFNILGQKVRTLVREQHTAGFYSVTWDARDELGIPVPSGMYIYRLTAGTSVESKRMVLIR